MYTKYFKGFLHINYMINSIQYALFLTISSSIGSISRYPHQLYACYGSSGSHENGASSLLILRPLTPHQRT